ncbi:MAG: hypothetical protein ACRCZF_15290 [Gemmataceae bacterium]
MGWSSYGYVATAEPNLAGLSALAPSAHRMVLYRHRSLSLWLSGFAKARTKGAAVFNHHPDVDWKLEPRRLNLATRNLFRTLGEFHELVPIESVGQAIAAMQQSVSVATAAAVPIYRFAADDEFQDFGGKAAPQQLLSFAGRTPEFILRVDGLKGTWRLLLPLGSPLIELEKPVLAAVRKLPGVTVVIPRDTPTPKPRKGVPPPARLPGVRSAADTADLLNQHQLYRHAAEGWPHDGGDPTELLGLGTWDLFDPFEREFVLLKTPA